MDKWESLNFHPEERETECETNAIEVSIITSMTAKRGKIDTMAGSWVGVSNEVRMYGVLHYLE